MPKRLLAFTLSAVLLAGCGGGARDAAAMAHAYLEAVSGSSGDRGWDLLHPEIRRLVFGNSADAYVTMMDASDWSRFEWSIVEVIADDPSLHFVRLRLPNGPESVPPALRKIGPWSIVAILPDGRGHLDIRVGYLSPWVWAVGG